MNKKGEHIQGNELDVKKIDPRWIKEKLEECVKFMKKYNKHTYKADISGGLMGAMSDDFPIE